MDSDGNKNKTSTDAKESTAIRIDEEGIVELRAHRRRDFAQFRQTERSNRIYVDEMWKIIKEEENRNEMNNCSENFEIKLNDACKAKHLRKTIANSGRQMAGICRCMQDQWLSVLEACKYSVYVNNVWLKFTY